MVVLDIFFFESVDAADKCVYVCLIEDGMCKDQREMCCYLCHRALYVWVVVDGHC